METIPNIRHLAAFAATVDHGSVTAAAGAVALTQPALTQAIARLERDLECRLFHREASGMRPTEPALLLHPRAVAALERIGSNRITATQMRAFLAVYRAGSYVAAAAQTGLAPPSLHRAVADLSLALQERLVERHGRKLAFTAKGAMRGRNFALAMADLRAGYTEIATWRGKAGGRIVIGAMPLSRARWLPRAVAEFRATYPQVAIAVVEGSHGERAPLLRDGDVDMLLGAVREDKAVEDLEQLRVFDDHPQIVMRGDHPLVRSAAPGLAELRAYPWVLPGVTTPLFGFFKGLFASDGGDIPEVGIECGSVLTIRELLRTSDMLTLLSPDQIAMEVGAGELATLPPPAPIARSIGIATRRNWMPTAQQRDLLEILRSYPN